jgi:hypothetical protein
MTLEEPFPQICNKLLPRTLIKRNYVLDVRFYATYLEEILDTTNLLGHCRA